MDDDLPFSDDEKDKLIKYLGEVKILDPACGSGAFPIGALQKIVFILQQIDPDAKKMYELEIKQVPSEFKRFIQKEYENGSFDYLRKLRIIRDCIYGVDIQPIATEISRLRCFLTLVVEQRIDDTQENRGIQPLPNLDFKFVTANSLIGLPKIDKSQGTLFDNYEKIDELKNVRDDYFSATGIDREQLKTEFAIQQKRLFMDLQKEHGWTGIEKSELTSKLSDWEPFTHKATSWFDPEWMFGFDKFDIVIANPPYIEHKKLKSVSRILKENYTVYTGSSDLSVYFFEFAYRSLKEAGILSYISTNKFFNTEYGKKLREYLLEKQIQKIINFEQIPVFDNVLVSSCVIVSSNYKINKETLDLKILYKDNNWKENFNNKTFEEYPIKYLKNYEWSFKSKNNIDIKQKIEKNSSLLMNLDGVYIRRGITTGYDPAFIINEEIKNTLGNYDILKPLLKGEHIKKYRIKKSGLWLINSHNGLKKDHLKPINLPLDYPSIFAYIVKIDKENNAAVKKRSDQGNNWFNLRNCAFLDEFDKPKIIWPLTADKWGFSFDDQKHFLASGSFMLTSKNIDLMYILGVLNSKLMNYYFSHIGVMTAGGAFTLKKTTIERLPFKLAENTNEIGRIVTKIYQEINKNFDSDISMLESQIDNLVYEIYGLTEEEIKIVEREGKND